MVFTKKTDIFATKSITMKKTASLKIFYNFLKGIKKIGTFEYYLHNPDSNVAEVNMRILKDQIYKIEETDPTDSSNRKTMFEDIIGNMCSGHTPLQNDYFFPLYRQWTYYLNTNWTEIDKQYLELKNKMNHAENV